MKSVTIKIGDYDVEVLEKIFANESDFKPRDPRDELIVEIMRQVVPILSIFSVPYNAMASAQQPMLRSVVPVVPLAL